MRIHENKEEQENPTPPEEKQDLWWYRQLYQDVEFTDDDRGGALDKEPMIKARRAEMQSFKKLGVYSTTM